MTTNQILVACLILVLVAFVVVMAIMAKHAIELIKKTKVLVGDGQDMVNSSKAKVDEIGDKIVGAATSVAEDTAPTIKALGATATGLTAINVARFVGRSILRRGGLLEVMADRRDRKNSRKEIKKSRKLVKQINKQTALEAKAIKKSKKVAKKASKVEKKLVKKASKAEKKMNKKASKKAAKMAKKEAKVAKKADKKARKAAKK